MDLSRRIFVAGLGGGALAAGLSRWQGAEAPEEEVLRPEDFGARGDGETNDSAAFAALAERVNALDGGIIDFRRATYLVGAQQQRAGPGSFAFEPAKLLEIAGCSRPVIIRGNGARIRCADRLRYGTFDPRSGAATRHPMPYLGDGELATPYRWMISLSDCTGPVEISDLELDGNLPRLLIGGPRGDIGHQIPAVGLALFNNHGPEIVRNLHTHHHAWDGLLIDGLDQDRLTRSRFERVRSEHNGRQGCSFVGGRGYDFSDSHFNHTGRGGLASAPGAGVDIEAENGKKIRDLTFSRCEFSDNDGPGMIADSGDSEGAVFSRCTFVGTTAWAAFPDKPRFRFDGCTFVGPIAQAYGDRQRPERAAQFLDCVFRDDPSLSPTGRLYRGENAAAPAADLPGNPNVLFARCAFQLDHDATLPWSLDVTYQDCTMAQASAAPSYPRGTWLGSNTIRGPAILTGSTVVGEVTLNGTRLQRGQLA